MSVATGFLGLGSTSLAVALNPYGWVFMLLAVCSLVAGFYFNVLRRSSTFSRAMYWISVVATVATLLKWGWWRL